MHSQPPYYPWRCIEYSHEAHKAASLRSVVPGQPYYLTPVMLKEVRTVEAHSGQRVIRRIDGYLDMYSRYHDQYRWKGEDLNNKRVGILHTGHLGDAICMTAAVAQLKHTYPAAEIHLHTYPNAVPVWQHNRDVYRVQPVMYGLTAAEIAAMEYWLIPKPLPYYRRSGSANYYDLLEQAVGFPIELQRPYLYVPDMIRTQLHKEFNRLFPGALSSPYIYVQTTASEPCRTPGYNQPDYWYERLAALQAALPGHWLFLAGNADDMPGFMERYIREPLHGVNVNYLESPRHNKKMLQLPYTFEMVRGAELVIGPDSLSGHVAAAFDVPALWLFNTLGRPSDRIPPPLSRIGTYPLAEWRWMHSSPPELVNHVQLMLYRYRNGRN